LYEIISISLIEVNMEEAWEEVSLEKEETLQNKTKRSRDRRFNNQLQVNFCLKKNKMIFKIPFH